MNMITQTMTKVVFETAKEEIEKHGFDYIWDQIRDDFSEDEYVIHSIQPHPQDPDYVYIELIARDVVKD